MNAIIEDIYLEHLHKGELEQAEFTLIRALATSGPEPVTWYEFCRVLLLRGKLKEALESLEVLEKVSPNWKDTRKAMKLIRQKIEAKPMSVYS